MDPFFRIGGLYGAVTANVLLWSVMNATLAGYWCEELGCRGGRYPAGGPEGPRTIPTATVWQPFVDNPGRYLQPAAAGPSCPEPRAPDVSVAVQDSVLPTRFDPYGYPGRKLYACFKVSWTGEIEAARLLAGTGNAAVDRSLVAAIRGGGWRFSMPWTWEEGALWQRVRLDAGPIERVAIPPTDRM